MSSRSALIRRAVLVFGVAISALLLLSTLLEERHDRVRAAERGLEEPAMPQPIELPTRPESVPRRPQSLCERGSAEARIRVLPLVAALERGEPGILVRAGQVWLQHPALPQSEIDYLGPDPDRLDPAERTALLLALDRLREVPGPTPRRLDLPEGPGWRELALQLLDGGQAQLPPAGR